MEKSIYKDKVSVIVLNWNGEQYIRQCLDSLLNQTYSNYELIVVDNNSNDNSRMILAEEYCGIIKLIVSKKNVGFAAGNNLGIKVACGQLIVILNNDTVVDKNWLFELVNGLNDPPQADIVSSLVYYYNPSNQIWCDKGRFDLVTGLIWHASRKRKDYITNLEADYFPGCALLIKKSVFDKIGLFDERFFLYSEDPDFCLRAKKAGFKLKLIPSAQVWHMVSMSSLSNPFLSEKLKLTSDFKLIFKAWPFWCVPITLLFKLLIVPIADIYYRHKKISNLLLTWRVFFGVLFDKNFRAESFQSLKSNPHLHNRFNEVLYLMKNKYYD